MKKFTKTVQECDHEITIPFPDSHNWYHRCVECQTNVSAMQAEATFMIESHKVRVKP